MEEDRRQKTEDGSSLLSSVFRLLSSLFRAARDFLQGMAVMGYRRQLRAEAMELNDLFMLLCFMETLGLPNPAALYLLDVYPYFLEEFHLWHRRMGMDRSPLATFGCC